MSEPANNQTAVNDGKKKMGAYLTSKGAIIGAGIGTVLVALGGVLEENTSWVGAILEVIKSFLF